MKKSALTMKIVKTTTFCSIAAVFFACQKDPVSKPVQFTSTEYNALTTFDSTGKPAGLQREDISSDLLSYVNDELPEGKDLRTTNPGLLSGSNSDIHITQTSDVYLTFVSQRTVNKDAIAFYTYPTTNPPTSPHDIKKITYVFPNAGAATPLAAGSTLKIGTFQAGTSVGMVLLQNAWDASTKQINNSAVHFCYNDVLNPEVDPALKKHVVVINYAAENKLLIGFEDLDRTTKACDHDFNDVVLYATIK